MFQLCFQLGGSRLDYGCDLPVLGHFLLHLIRHISQLIGQRGNQIRYVVAKLRPDHASQNVKESCRKQVHDDEARSPRQRFPTRGLPDLPLKKIGGRPQQIRKRKAEQDGLKNASHCAKKRAYLLPAQYDKIESNRCRNDKKHPEPPPDILRKAIFSFVFFLFSHSDFLPFP